MELKALLSEMQGDSSTGYVQYEKFEATVLQRLLDQEFPRDSDDRLLAAFHALDPERRGFIESETLREMLMTKGEMFTEDEVDDLLAFAADAETGLVHYEDYCTMLEMQ